MDRSDETTPAFCADCGREIAPEIERGFRFGEAQALCFGCAERRGGTFDERTDHWTREPDLTDLPPDV